MLTAALMRWRRMLIAVAIAVALAIPAWGQESRAIAIGPYVQNVSPNMATICWATATGQVTYAKAGADSVTVTEYQYHSIVLRNLEPATTYSYEVPGGGSDVARGVFTTVPSGEHPFTFMVLGDTQSRDNPGHRGIVERIIAGKPDLVFNTGDLVSDGRNIGDWENFFGIERDLMRSVPYYPALGNHEKHSSAYLSFFALPGNECYYSFDRGAAHFVVLDTPGPYPEETNSAATPQQNARFAESREQYWQRQMEWLREDLAASRGAKYVFVFFHYPPYSALARAVAEARQMRERLGSVFQDYTVSAVFSGHDHNYHRAVAGGVQFVVAGVSGGRPRPVDAPQPESVKYVSAVTFVQVDVRPDRAAARVVDIDGKVIDEFEMLPRAALSIQ